MVEHRVPLRPPAAPGTRHSLGRPGTSLGNDPGRRVDEESLREAQTHLRANVAQLRRDNAEMKQKCRDSESDSLRKDKLLQELLAMATGGSCVPGEALDRLREDLQALLQFKRQAQETRRLLDDKEQKVLAIRQELKASRVLEMEEDVANAKAEAKRKKETWVEANSSDKVTHCYVETQKHQRAAKDLIRQRTEAENQTSISLQRLVNLEDEKNHLEKAVSDSREQIDKLEAKRDEIDAKSEETQQRLADLKDVEERHDRLVVERDEVSKEVGLARQQAAELKMKAANAPPPRREAPPAWEICVQVLTPGFQPLRPHSSSESKMLFWRLRKASEHGQQSLLAALTAQDAPGSGRLSASGLAKVMQQLEVAGSKDTEAVRRLVECLDPCLLDAEGRISIADFVLSLPLQRSCVDVEPSDADLEQALGSLSLACRRREVSEAALRRQFEQWLSAPGGSLDFEGELQRYCETLQIPPESGARIAAVLGVGLELRRHHIGNLVPPWSLPSAQSSAMMLGRFLRDLSVYRDSLPVLHQDLGGFVKVVGATFGDRWEKGEIEKVALLAEASTSSGEGLSLAIRVDTAKLLRASQPAGFTAEFLQQFTICPKALQEAVEKEAADASQRPPLEGAVVQQPLLDGAVAAHAPATLIGSTANEPPAAPVPAAPVMVKCSACKGSGKCADCDGVGLIFKMVCMTCKKGRKGTGKCQTCMGSKQVEQEGGSDGASAPPPDMPIADAVMQPLVGRAPAHLASSLTGPNFGDGAARASPSGSPEPQPAAPIVAPSVVEQPAAPLVAPSFVEQQKAPAAPPVGMGVVEQPGVGLSNTVASATSAKSPGGADDSYAEDFGSFNESVG